MIQIKFVSPSCNIMMHRRKIWNLLSHLFNLLGNSSFCPKTKLHMRTNSSKVNIFFNIDAIIMKTFKTNALMNSIGLPKLLKNLRTKKKRVRFAPFAYCKYSVGFTRTLKKRCWWWWFTNLVVGTYVWKPFRHFFQTI